MKEIKKLLPEIPDSWIPFNKVNYNDSRINAYHIDTRDFHVSLVQDIKERSDINTLLKYENQFFFTSNEVKELINNWYSQTPQKPPIMFYLQGYEDWRFKYTRIYRTKHGFLMCDRNDRAYKKKDLNRKFDNIYDE